MASGYRRPVLLISLIFNNFHFYSRKVYSKNLMGRCLSAGIRPMTDKIALLIIRFMKPIIFIILVLSVFSCEYEPPEKFTHVEPNNSPPTLTNQTLDFNSDTLYIWSATRFCFDFRSSDQPIEGITVEYLGKTSTFEGCSGYFDVDPANIQAGASKVRMNVYTHTGRGSLADVTGYESYVFSKEWTLVYETVASLKVKFTNVTVENGNLVVHWQKFKRPYFNCYKITATDSALNYSFSKVINDADSAFLIDPSFVGGSVKFSLLISFKKWDGTTMDYVSDNFTYRFPVKVTFDERPDSLTIHWTEIPFKHTVLIFSNQINLGSAKSYTIKAPGLGALASYQLAIKPTVKLTWDHQMYYVYTNYTMGSKSAMTFTRMAYFPEINSYLLKHAMYFRKFDGTTLGRLRSYDYSWDYYDDATIAFSPDYSQAFTTNNQNIVQLNSSTFGIISSKKFTPSAIKSYYFRLIKVLNDSLMYVATSNDFSIYNYNTCQVIYTMHISEISGSPFNLSVSNDGQYLANCNTTSLRVYRNSGDTSFVKIYETTGSFLECTFDPVNINNLLMQTTTNSYIFSCPDMQLVAEIPNSVKGMGVNFDPVTGYLLYVSATYGTVTVYDYQNGLIKFKCNHHGYFDEFYLANNTIFHQEGYNLNISSYVK